MISGTGAVTQIGDGTTSLTGANTLRWHDDDLGRRRCSIGDGGTTGTLGTGAVTNNADLAFNRSNALTVANVISGTGTVNQVGAGTTDLDRRQQL